MAVGNLPFPQLLSHGRAWARAWFSLKPTCSRMSPAPEPSDIAVGSPWHRPPVHSHPFPVTPQLPSWAQPWGYRAGLPRGAPRQMAGRGVGHSFLPLVFASSIVLSLPRWYQKACRARTHPPSPSLAWIAFLWLDARPRKIVGGVWCFGPERCPSLQGLPATGGVAKAGPPPSPWGWRARKPSECVLTGLLRRRPWVISTAGRSRLAAPLGFSLSWQSHGLVPGAGDQQVLAKRERPSTQVTATRGLGRARSQCWAPHSAPGPGGDSFPVSP